MRDCLFPVRRRAVTQRPIGEQQRPSGVQNRPFSGGTSATQPPKGNRVIEVYGAGDGNRTHVRSLGSTVLASPLSTHRTTRSLAYAATSKRNSMARLLCTSRAPGTTLTTPLQSDLLPAAIWDLPSDVTGWSMG